MLPAPERWRRVVDKLLRVSGPRTYRLMAVNLGGEHMIGETAGGLSLKDDIAAYQGRDCKPLYAVFVRPKGADQFATTGATDER